MSLGQEGLTALVEVFQELGKVFQELFEFSKMTFQVMKNAICMSLGLETLKIQVFSGWELKKKLKSAICMSLRLWASKIHVFGGRALDLERRWGRGLQRLGTC